MDQLEFVMFNHAQTHRSCACACPNLYVIRPSHKLKGRHAARVFPVSGRRVCMCLFVENKRLH